MKTPDVCPRCRRTGAVTVSLFQRYLHIFWIPFVPAGKVWLATCEQCGMRLHGNEVRRFFPVDTSDLLLKARTPPWIYTGPAALLVLAALAFWWNARNREQSAALIATPRRGDVYEIKTADGKYSAIQIEQVREDAVEVRIARLSTDKVTALRRLLKRSDLWSDSTARLSRKDIQERFAHREILAVIRE